MADSKKENGQDGKGVEILSLLSEKHQDHLDGLSELMENTDGVYGPFLMEELQRRLELVVQNFNEDVKALIEGSFKKWKIKDSQLRDLMKGTILKPKSQPKTKKTKDSSAPNFIKNVKFGPIRPK